MLRSFADHLGVAGGLQPFPRSRQVRSRIESFEASSAFSRVADCTLAEPSNGGLFVAVPQSMSAPPSTAAIDTGWIV